MPQEKKQAVVLSGGGAEGAYQVGILKALIHGRSPATGFRPLEPDLFAGTSIGSLNAAFLVARWKERGPAAIGDLERLWLDRLAEQPRGCGNGLYRFRGDPLSFAQIGCYLSNPLRPLLRMAGDSAFLGWDGLQRAVAAGTAEDQPLLQRMIDFLSVSSFVSTEPFEETLRATIDYKAIRDADKVLRLVATNWATGEIKTFSNADMTEESGPRAILASSAVPGFFPPAELGSQPYVDGGVLLNTPLRPAIRAGADVLHIIYMDPDIKRIPLSRLGNTLETFYRMQQIRWAASVNNDIAAAARINRGLALIRRLRQGRISAEDAPAFVEAADQIRQHLEKPVFRPLDIHRFHPRDPLGGALGFLNLRHGRIEELIERGFQDATHHDHEAAGDVLFEDDEGEAEHA